MQSIQYVFDTLWDAYAQTNPKVIEIRKLLMQTSHSSDLLDDTLGSSSMITNDHIALRTLRHERFGIDQLSAPFKALGYEVSGHYQFQAKKLDAIHLECKSEPKAPKVFISELLLEELSGETQSLLRYALIERCASTMNDVPLLAASGRHWGVPRYDTYERLLEESEYAAWFYVFGFLPNHFTVRVNDLSQFEHISELNAFLEGQGYQLNSSGGKIKGSPELLLEQSSTLADTSEVAFVEGKYQVPSVFYEFAQRYSMPNGVEFSGFVEGNADKIFESTNRR